MVVAAKPMRATTRAGAMLADARMLLTNGEGVGQSVTTFGRRVRVQFGRGHEWVSYRGGAALQRGDPVRFGGPP